MKAKQVKPANRPQGNPCALQGSMALCGRARFTLLTDRMIRLEWAEDGVFEDRATLTVSHRRLKKPAFEAKKRGDAELIIRTPELVLTYRETGRGFTRSNLAIRFKMAGKWAHWTPGMKDSLNLGGTVRTLDCADGDQFRTLKLDKNNRWVPSGETRPVDLGMGLLSRKGWAVVDDSNSAVLDPGIEAFTPWAVARQPGKRQDLYWLGYGLDYKRALSDASRVFGSQPLPPRYALGYWYSRYWAYTDQEIEMLVDDFDRMGVPLDVMVIDMDWHLPGWTGYTWDRDFFPDPDDLLAKLKRRGLRVTLNLHPADGVGRHEEAFPAMCRDLGLDPKHTERIPFDCTDAAYMASYFKRLHHPEENRGVDFWWMDWQQGSNTKIVGLDPLGWLNHLHWMDQTLRRPQRRALDFSRYCGLGSGRYPVGFSGDTYSTWKSLTFQPHLTSTAGNVLFGMWSHDIGGHFGGPEFTPELYTRWLQFGAYSPILRTHAAKNREADRRIWVFPEPYRDAMLEAIRQRYALIPYIYTELRKAEKHGLSLLRPMYIEHPTAQEAYTHPGQYYFGDHMIVAPVTRPVDVKTSTAEAEVWLPPGDWFDSATGCMVQGDSLYRQSYLIEDTPVFVKAGAIIPGQQDTMRLNKTSYDRLTIEVYPGGDGQYRLYEDDGLSTRYAQGESAWIELTHRIRKQKRIITIGKARGTYKGFKSNRKMVVRVHGCAPPTSVRIGGKVVSWRYDGENAVVIIPCNAVDLNAKTVIEVRLPVDAPAIFHQGWKVFMKRMKQVAALVNSVSPNPPLHPEDRLATRMAQTGNRIARRPETVQKEIKALSASQARLSIVLQEYRDMFREKRRPDSAAILDRALAILSKSDMPDALQ
jgi:hypothetical protein